jgi:hypothetical protein
MVREFHRAGYERLRIAPAMSPSGCHWRCAIGPASEFSLRNGALAVWNSRNLFAKYSVHSKQISFAGPTRLTAAQVI